MQESKKMISDLFCALQIVPTKYTIMPYYLTALKRH